MSRRLTPYGMSKRIKQHKEALKQAEQLGHSMTGWKFSKQFTNVSICYCKICQREIVCGLPLEPVIGRALKENCNVEIHSGKNTEEET